MKKKSLASGFISLIERVERFKWKKIIQGFAVNYKDSENGIKIKSNEGVA